MLRHHLHQKNCKRPRTRKSPHSHAHSSPSLLSQSYTTKYTVDFPVRHSSHHPSRDSHQDYDHLFPPIDTELETSVEAYTKQRIKDLLNGLALQGIPNFISTRQTIDFFLTPTGLTNMKFSLGGTSRYGVYSMMNTSQSQFAQQYKDIWERDMNYFYHQNLEINQQYYYDPDQSNHDTNSTTQSHVTPPNRIKVTNSLNYTSTAVIYGPSVTAPTDFMATRPLKGAIPQNANIVLYLHGGGFVMGSGRWVAYELFCFEMCRILNAQRHPDDAPFYLVSLDYRLAPDVQHPVPLLDCLSAYETLIKQFNPANIILSGDSAGGDLAFATGLALQHLKNYLFSQDLSSMNEVTPIKQPSAMILYSPLCNVSPSSFSVTGLCKLADIDDILPADAFSVAMQAYFGLGAKTPDKNAIAPFLTQLSLVGDTIKTPLTSFIPSLFNTVLDTMMFKFDHLMRKKILENSTQHLSKSTQDKPQQSTANEVGRYPLSQFRPFGDSTRDPLPYAISTDNAVDSWYGLPLKPPRISTSNEDEHSRHTIETLTLSQTLIQHYSTSPTFAKKVVAKGISRSSTEIKDVSEVERNQPLLCDLPPSFTTVGTNEMLLYDCLSIYPSLVGNEENTIQNQLSSKSSKQRYIEHFSTIKLSPFFTHESTLWALPSYISNAQDFSATSHTPRDPTHQQEFIAPIYLPLDHFKTFRRDPVQPTLDDHPLKSENSNFQHTYDPFTIHWKALSSSINHTPHNTEVGSNLSDNIGYNYFLNSIHKSFLKLDSNNNKPRKNSASQWDITHYATVENVYNEKCDITPVLYSSSALRSRQVAAQSAIFPVLPSMMISALVDLKNTILAAALSPIRLDRLPPILVKCKHKDVEFFIMPDMFHVYPLATVLPQSQLTLECVSEFANRQISQNDVNL